MGLKFDHVNVSGKLSMERQGDVEMRGVEVALLNLHMWGYNMGLHSFMPTEIKMHATVLKKKK